MYSWASPDYILDKMTLGQVLLFYRKGWEAKKTEAMVFWGVLGQALNGDLSDSGVSGLEEFRKANVGEILENGSWRLTK